MLFVHMLNSDYSIIFLTNVLLYELNGVLP